MTAINRLTEKIISLCLTVFIVLIATQGCKEREPNAPVEIDRPKSLTITPAPGQLVFPVNGAIEMMFDEPMELSSFDGKFVLLDSDSNSVSGTFSEHDSVVVFTPLQNLAPATIYSGSLNGNLRDLNGNSIDINGEGVFDDSTEITKTWFFSEGEYSKNGFYNAFVRDRKQGKIYAITNLTDLGDAVTSLNAPEGLAVSADGRNILVSNTSKNEIKVYDAVDFSEKKVLTVASNPTSIVVKGNSAYVISVNGKQLTEIDLTTLSVSKQKALSFFPGKLAVSADGSNLYTVDQVTLDLQVLNSADGSTKKKISKALTNILAGEIRYDNNSDRLFLCDTKGMKISVVDKEGSSKSDFYMLPDKLEPKDIVLLQNQILIIAGKKLLKISADGSALLAVKEFASTIQSIEAVPSGDVLYIALTTSIVLADVKTLSVLQEINLGLSGIESVIVSPTKQ